MHISVSSIFGDIEISVMSTLIFVLLPLNANRPLHVQCFSLAEVSNLCPSGGKSEH